MITIRKAQPGETEKTVYSKDLPNGFFTNRGGHLFYKNDEVIVSVDPAFSGIYTIKLREHGWSSWTNPTPVDVEIVTRERK